MPGQDAGKYNMTVCIERRGNSFDDQHMYILSSVKHYQTDHVLGHKGNLNKLIHLVIHSKDLLSIMKQTLCWV